MADNDYANYPEFLLKFNALISPTAALRLTAKRNVFRTEFPFQAHASTTHFWVPALNGQLTYKFIFLPMHSTPLDSTFCVYLL